MRLKPSEIYFSQDTIKNCFDHYGTIGSVLDKIYEGTMSIQLIPKISVCQKDGKWFTVDNRRLWIFQQLEKLGKCSEIDVQVTYSIPDNKFTTENGGASVTVRGDPGSKYATDVSWRRSRGGGRRRRFVDWDDDFSVFDSDDSDDSVDDPYDFLW
ncbi:hypothetical protein CHS0354_032363 [Potamilus streckersoni]|uniref:Uncharacterized protein n=1 Tax=Potamilus streckersoni TaxID=2493646 RepID=A0AAE0TGL5_9BIVA|nr:hypothetical protein CHS0354_032363 [Potamilus streckersoni]